MAASDPAIQGGCLCGAIRYAVNRPLLDADHCHCSKCRRQHGAAFATYARVTPGSFEWVSGGDGVRVYETGSGAGWAFCTHCGATLAGTDDGRVTSIALGTVEGDPGVRPGCHIFVGSKAPWYDITDALPRFDRRAPEK